MTKIFVNPEIFQFIRKYKLPSSYCWYLSGLILILSGNNRNICFAGQYSLSEFSVKTGKNKQTLRNFIKNMENYNLCEVTKNQYLNDLYHVAINPELNKFFIKK